MTVRFEDPRRVLARHGLQPKRGYSQNFLVSPRAVEGIVRACDVHPGDRVVELGAGCGSLTLALADTGAHVIAIERDPDMLQVLHAERTEPAFDIVPGDAKEVALSTFTTPQCTKVVVAGNLPYAITGAILRRLYDERAHLLRAVVMIQREVRDRMVAQPDTPEYGALSVFTAQVFAVETVLHLPRTAFHPPPKVTSSVVKLRPLDIPRAPVEPAFDRVVRAAFQARRKTLRNALGQELGNELAKTLLAQAGIDPIRRGETLSVEEFGAIAAALRHAGS
jgi:16S rRNA (adenine1518-N6/adenine1519-N6)-dimethyltransferase